MSKKKDKNKKRKPFGLRGNSHPTEKSGHTSVPTVGAYP